MTAPETTSSFLARLELADALDRVEKLQDRGTDPIDIVAQMVEHHGAVVKFTSGTNVLRCCGVSGTCTRDRAAGMLASWQRIAERRFGKYGSARALTPLVASAAETQAATHG